MLRMAVGHSDDVDARDALAAAISQVRDVLGDARPTLAILACATDPFDPSLIADVRTAFPGIHVAGMTAAAQVSSAGGYLEDSVSLAAFAPSADVAITVGHGPDLDRDMELACRTAVDRALAGTTLPPRFAIVFISATAGDPALILAEIRQDLPAGVELIGGGAARNELGATDPTYQFVDESVSEQGVVVILFSGAVAHSVAIGTGWTPVGAVGTITAAAGGTIREIDGRPALEFLSRYLDATGPASFGNPIAVFEGDAAPYLRVALRSDPVAGTVTLIGSVPVGARVSLTTARTDDILGGASDALRRAAAGFPSTATPEAALLFSCTVRKFLLGSRVGRETELARAALGSDIPFAGLYCTGEIGPIGSGAGSRFLNETFVALLLGT